MQVKVDASAVHELVAEATKSLRAIPREMKRVLDAKAREERRTHGYQNRTGYLEASTYASEIETSGDTSSVEFGARATYASFLEARGLQDVTVKADDAAAELATMFEFLADGLSR